MKNFLTLILTGISVAYSLWFAAFGGFVGNRGALSKIGLSHPVLFCLWGALTFLTLALLLTIGYGKTKYKFYTYLLTVAGVGMALTLFCDFDYDLRVQYYLHCIGSMSFSVVTSANVLLLFFLQKRYILGGVCAGVVAADFILLLIFKETAFIELFPIFAGYALLLINNFKEKALEADTTAQRT